MHTGTIRVYTGGGKGKTTSALGEAVNALLSGKCVCMFQFMKPVSRRGEETLIDWFPHDLLLLPVGRPGFRYISQTPTRTLPRHTLDAVKAQRALKMAREFMHGERYHLMILDEINMAVYFQLIPVEALLEFMETKPKGTHLVLTGQKAHPLVIQRADHVVEIRDRKHYYHAGVPARIGIEY